jgi:hypothetical protein
VVEAGLAAYPLARAGSLQPLVAVGALLALVLLLLALVGFAGLVPWSIGVAGAGFVVIDAARTEPVLAAPFVGAGLLLVAELAYASRELARGPEEDARRRATRLAAVSVVALVAAMVPAVATGFTPPSGASASLVALVASAVLLVPPVLLLRARARGSGR